jgi:hypothetical protein
MGLDARKVTFAASFDGVFAGDDVADAEPGGESGCVGRMGLIDHGS